MTRDEYDSLCEKYISGKCTPTEREAIETYKDSFELANTAWDESALGKSEDTKRAILHNLNKSIKRSEHKSNFRITTWSAAACIALFIVSAVIYSRTLQSETIALKDDRAPVVVDDIPPGENKAVLILDDGSRINLDDAESGLLARQNNTIIKKLPDGQLHYVAGPPKSRSEITFNTVATPRGGQFKITLPDGSRVWLNAGSSLRFPTMFTGSDRKVELTGEAYFEIATNMVMPFKVLANGAEIRVLGTHFNIMAYADETQMNTTLVEGSVQVFKGTDQVMIKPGQSAIFNKSTEKLTVGPADGNQAVAWKNGYFVFVDEDIESIMRKVSRWYNVEISFRGNMNNKNFTGTISRNKNVSELLQMLELTGAIHFNIVQDPGTDKGRRITVMP